MEFDYNNLVNFDWFYPKYAHRHSQKEIEKWIKKLGLTVKIFNDVQSGFYISALKSKNI